MPAKKKAAKSTAKKKGVRSSSRSQEFIAEEENYSETEEEQELDPRDPFGPYIAPVPKRTNTFFEEFRVWMHSAKGWLYGLLLIAIAGPLFYMLGTLRSPSHEELLEYYFTSRNSGGAGESSAYTVGQFQRSQADLIHVANTIRMFTFGEGATALRSDSEEYANFVESQYEIDLLANAALQQGLLDNPDFRTYLENSMRESVARGYVLYRLKDRLPARTEILKGASPEKLAQFRKEIKSEISEEQWKRLSDEDIRRGYQQAQMQRIQETIMLQRRLLVQEAKQSDRTLKD
ncbi:MAG TPA: hypothetical protein DEA96_15635 [Leptospiraceae bacterium]|nr:hypothetical protein [Spirochaetaceae bacterium]HBS06399.1 hypothetical protein [Leptospiraceae bacterium]|tara:strand:- start:12644 stop:13513 length:870 start_codon:yes stop_codon:yes gene_type:complete